MSHADVQLTIGKCPKWCWQVLQNFKYLLVAVQSSIPASQSVVLGQADPFPDWACVSVNILVIAVSHSDVQADQEPSQFKSQKMVSLKYAFSFQISDFKKFSKLFITRLSLFSGKKWTNSEMRRTFVNYQHFDSNSCAT